MKRLIVIIMISAFLCLPAVALAVKGVVVYLKSGCSYYIVEAPLGYALLQWFGGSSPSRGDVLVGDYESYGMKDIYNITQDSETKVWVDNFWMSKDRVIERYFEKCH